MMNYVVDTHGAGVIRLLPDCYAAVIPRRRRARHMGVRWASVAFGWMREPGLIASQKGRKCHADHSAVASSAFTSGAGAAETPKPPAPASL
jgi:hypothetical protein